jgi:hypothetical protein
MMFFLGLVSEPSLRLLAKGEAGRGIVVPEELFWYFIRLWKKGWTPEAIGMHDRPAREPMSGNRSRVSAADAFWRVAGPVT